MTTRDPRRRTLISIALMACAATAGCSAAPASGLGLVSPAATAPGTAAVASAAAPGPTASGPVESARAEIAPGASAPPAPPDAQPQGSGAGPQYTVEQAISDRAQENTIAFDALGFLTGTFGSDTFFPPGKVADFWGFQYLRDNDPSAQGHNTDFLTSASLNMLDTLTEAQRQQLITLAKSQVDSINAYATKRFVLMAAFRRLLAGDLPAGTASLSETAVEAYSATLYQLDGQISLERARVMGPMLAGLTSAQRASLDAMVGKGMTSWPAASEPADLQGLTRDQKIAVMTYAGDLFSWYAGSVEADTYFCPERHGTYFGSFYLKDAPAVGNAGYSISTTITNDLGSALLSGLDAAQAARISGLVEAQRPALAQIVATRREIATQLRRYRDGGTVDAAAIAKLMTTYGQLDGSIVYQYATAFVAVGRSLTASEQSALQALRAKLLATLSTPTGAYLYSEPIAMPSVPPTDFLFE